MGLLKIVGRVRLNLAVATITDAETNAAIINAETMEGVNSGTAQTEKAVIFIISR